MSPGGYGRLVRRLAPVRAQAIERRDDPPADPEPDGSADNAVTTGAGPRQVVSDVREPAVLLTSPVPGSVLGLRFSADGSGWWWSPRKGSGDGSGRGFSSCASTPAPRRWRPSARARGWSPPSPMTAGCGCSTWRRARSTGSSLARDSYPTEELAAADNGAVVAIASGRLVWLAGDALGGAEVQSSPAHALRLRADGRAVVWREGRDGRDLRTATGERSWAYGPWARTTALSPDGEAAHALRTGLGHRHGLGVGGPGEVLPARAPVGSTSTTKRLSPSTSSARRAGGRCPRRTVVAGTGSGKRERPMW